MSENTNGTGEKKKEKPKTHTTVRYRTHYETEIEKDGTELKLPQWATVRYENSGIKRYLNCLYALIGVNGVARDLIDWLSLNMKSDNMVQNNVVERNRFITYLKKNIKPDMDYRIPSERTIEAAYQKLAARNILIPVRKGYYIVNGEYVMRSDNEENRNQVIKMILEFKNGMDTTLKREIKEK